MYLYNPKKISLLNNKNATSMDLSATITLIFTIIYFLLIAGTMLIVLTDNANPQKTTAWLIVLIFIPAIGLVFYYVFG